MNDKALKKELLAQYKQRKIVGGVFVIRNMQTGKILLDSAVNLQGSINKFDFSKHTSSCVSMKLQKDWNIYGKNAFEFEILEELEKKQEQDEADFQSDILLLLECWREKLEDHEQY